METKLKAAEMVTQAGICALIGDGYNQRLSEVLNNEKMATLFLPSSRKMSSRSSWIAFTGQSNGTITIDEGAQKALVEKGKSLLPAGIKEVTGEFKPGDKVDIQARSGKVVARGLVNYSSHEIKLIAGCKTSEIASRIGEKRFDEAVHRDNLVCF